MRFPGHYPGIDRMVMLDVLASVIRVGPNAHAFDLSTGCGPIVEEHRRRSPVCSIGKVLEKCRPQLDISSCIIDAAHQSKEPLLRQHNRIISEAPDGNKAMISFRCAVGAIPPVE